MATLTTDYQLLATSQGYGTFGNNSGKAYIRLYAKYSGQSVANNTSLVYVKLVRYVTSNYSGDWYGCYQKDATLSGSLSHTYSDGNYKRYYVGESTIFEQPFTVNHNTDGSKSLTLAATYDDSYTSAVSIGSVTCTLPTIPRASTPVLSDYSIVLGQNVSIYTNAASSAFRHTISYNWYSLENGEPAWVTIATDVTDVVHWRVPVEFAENLHATDRGTGKIRCETYNGTTRLGTSIIEFEGVVSSTSEFYPTIESVLIDEPTGHGARYGALVKGYSNLRVKSQAFPKYGATIAKYTVIVDGQTYEGEDITTDTILSPDSDVVTVEVHAVDSRGIGSPVYTEEFAILDYSPPAVTALSVHRCDADGSANDEGEYVSAKFTASITPLRNYNSTTYTLRYTPMGLADATTKTLTVSVPSASRYAPTDFVIPPVAMDGSYTYSIELEAKDDLNKASRATSVSTAFTLISWGPDGTSMAIGKVAEKENTLEVALDLDATGDAHLRGGTYLYDSAYLYGYGFFFGDVHFYGNVTGSVNDAIKDYVIETGTEAMGSNGTWYWRKWASGRAECYGVRNYGTMTTNTAWGSLYVSSAFTQSLPSGLFVAAPEYVNIVPKQTSYSLWTIYGGATATSTTSTITFNMCRAVSGNVGQVHLGFNAIGRWK